MDFLVLALLFVVLAVAARGIFFHLSVVRKKDVVHLARDLNPANLARDVRADPAEVLGNTAILVMLFVLFLFVLFYFKAI